MKAIIGRKIGMTRIFTENGQVVPVTLIYAQPNVVTQVKTLEKDGYAAVQLALPESKKVKKPQEGHIKKAQIEARNLKEFKLVGEFKITDKVDLSTLDEVKLVNVTAISKGKGFAGTVKRHGFHLGPKTHGSDNYRRPGSIGAQQPQRVIKGKKMAGHLGHEQVTVKNLQVVNIDTPNHLLMIRGAVPGPRKGLVYVWSE